MGWFADVSHDTNSERHVRFGSLDRGLRPAVRSLLPADHGRRFVSFPFTRMVPSNDEAKRPASNDEDATSSAESPADGTSHPHFKLKDGSISVTVFAKTKGKDVHLFIVPERSYRDAQDKWHTTHILHEEDLPRLSLLLLRTYAHLRHSSQEFKSK